MDSKLLTLNRLYQEFQLCSQDNDLLNNLGCKFGLVNNNYFNWKVTMKGPKNTPYEDGIFTILINFHEDYPKHGPEFKFENKIYHTCVNIRKDAHDFGRIDLTSLNEWKCTGKVRGIVYNVKHALADIFYLFYIQSLECPFDEEICELYHKNPEKFFEEAKLWTKLYASPL